MSMVLSLDDFQPSTPQPTASSARPLIVDSFAGGGGASTGIEMALGRSPDIAINHNPAALALHAANHPQTLHLSENVYRVDPLDYLRGRHIGLMHFSPDCKHFSKAKGGKPVERSIRDLAWIIPGWIERIQKSGGKVDVVTMENVEEWKDWGPLLQTGKGLLPDPDRRGETFAAWSKAIKKLGGKIEFRELRACDFGAPTIRKRLFLIIRFDGKPIVWPQPTHGAPDDPDVIAGKKLAWRTAAECIDWTLACPSIFDTSEQIMEKHRLRSVRPLANATMARVARGMKRYVLDAERPFIVNLAHGARLEDVDAPLNTITGANRGEKAVVAPHIASYYSHTDGRAERTSELSQPLATVTTENRHAVIAPVLTYAQQGGASRSVEQPHHTICANSKDQNQVACAFIAQHNKARSRDGGVNPGRAADEPLSTVTGTGSQQGAVSAFIARQFGTSTGHAIDQPSATVMADGAGKSQLVAPYLQKYYGTGNGARADEPMHTVTTKDRFGHVEAGLSAPPFSPEHEDRARQVADFMRSYGFWDDREFVTLDIDGQTFVVVDIGIRMLTPRELYNAQGFPPDYIIDGVWSVPESGGDPVWVNFSKSVQVSCVGNSVSPLPYDAIVAANCPELMVVREAAE
ncbi:DNA cytosine methyltransferase [Rhizobium sp.]|jgi:DNA (cytosine-5)-methyltransferase 1|uniref:DNA cytosine methyltransferase n=1 Tax=Rhizobium sp. TaxID=391 RepID=UPI000E954334|nr:hypothetical protein [Rhizobium sp.]